MHKSPVNSLVACCILNFSQSSLQHQNQDMTPVGVVLIWEIIILSQDELMCWKEGTEDDLAAAGTGCALCFFRSALFEEVAVVGGVHLEPRPSGMFQSCRACCTAFKCPYFLTALRPLTALVQRTQAKQGVSSGTTALIARLGQFCPDVNKYDHANLF